MSGARQSALVDVRLLLLLDGTYVLMAQRCDQSLHRTLESARRTRRECTICAARREIAEETSVHVLHDEFTFVAASHYAPPGRSEKNSFAFAARRWDGTPIVTEPDRCSAVARHPLEHLPSPMVPQAAEAIRLLAAQQAFEVLD